MYLQQHFFRRIGNFLVLLAPKLPWKPPQEYIKKDNRGHYKTTNINTLSHGIECSSFWYMWTSGTVRLFPRGLPGDKFQQRSHINHPQQARNLKSWKQHEEKTIQNMAHSSIAISIGWWSSIQTFQGLKTQQPTHFSFWFFLYLCQKSIWLP